MGSQPIKCIDPQSGTLFASGYAYWTTGSKTIEIELDYCGVATWRIRGLASQNDSKAYLTVASGGLNGSFEASDTSGSKGYILQVYDGAKYFNSSDGSGTFYPFSDSDGDSDGEDDDDDDDGGGSSGGSSGSSDSYYIYYYRGEGTSLSVERTWNESTGVSYEGEINSGTRIVWKDVFDVTARALSGYQDAEVVLDNCKVMRETNNDDGSITYKVTMESTGNINIESSATKIGSDSGGDDDDDENGSGNGSGGSSGSTTNGIITPNSVTQNGVTATLTLSGSTITVRVSSTSYYWRINGTNSGGDHGTYYITQNTNSSGTFTAEDNHTYAFQVASGGHWSDGDFFTVNFDSDEGGDDGGDSGGDDTGGGTGSSGSDTASAGGVTMKATWTTGPKVTVTITSLGGYNAGLYWRVKGVKSEGDENTYISDTNSTTASFNQDVSVKNYTFQICPNGNWINDNGTTSVFTVDFGEDSGGDSGGGSDSVVSRTLHIEQGEGTVITVERTWSDNGNYTGKDGNWDSVYLSDGDEIWFGTDVFVINAYPLDGYEIDYYDLEDKQCPFATSNLTFANESKTRLTLLYDDDVFVETTATLVSTTHIYDGTGFNRYSCYIYNENNSSWDRYVPYIYNKNNSSWNRYS